VRPCVLVTAGDPAGIGYELAAAVASSNIPVQPLIIAERDLWSAAATSVGLRARAVILQELLVGSLTEHLIPRGAYGLVPLLHRAAPGAVKSGRLNAASGRCALDALDAACRIIETGGVHRRYGLLTMPVSKAAIRETGVPFPGHTEYLAHRFNVRDIAMLMIGKGRNGEHYHVLLLTRHVPLQAVSRQLHRERCAEQILATAAFITAHRLTGERPLTVLLCGVNPHTGERGTIGTEEQGIFRKIALRVRRNAPVAGIGTVECPVLAEYAFSYAARHPETLIVCSYHDQGMVPLKLLCGHVIANVTVGLPFVRVSPGHGTAADIAGTGTADRAPTFFALEVLQRCLSVT